MFHEKKLKQLLSFLHKTEGLKNLLRHSWLSSGRQESVAEHTWRLTLMVLVLAPEFDSNVDVARAIKIALVHDLGEIYGGDHHSWKGKLDDKYKNEREGIEKLLESLPKKQADEIFALWQEYEEVKTTEAKFVKALDKLEVLIQHNQADISTWNEKEYEFNLVYGETHTKFSLLTRQLHSLIKQDTRKKIEKNT